MTQQARDLLACCEALLELAEADAGVVYQEYGSRDPGGWEARRQVLAYCRDVVSQAKQERPAAGAGGAP